MTYDLLRAGFHVWQIGSPALSWDEFNVWLRFCEPSSQLFKEIRGPQWSPELHRLTDIFEALQAANWQRGNAGKPSPSPRPKPVKRPGMGGEKIGAPVDLDVVRDRLAMLNGRAP